MINDLTKTCSTTNCCFRETTSTTNCSNQNCFIVSKTTTNSNQAYNKKINFKKQQKTKIFGVFLIIFLLIIFNTTTTIAAKTNNVEIEWSPTNIM